MPGTLRTARPRDEATSAVAAADETDGLEQNSVPGPTAVGRRERTKDGYQQKQRDQRRETITGNTSQGLAPPPKRGT
jgi:hypothetical protein